VCWKMTFQARVHALGGSEFDQLHCNLLAVFKLAHLCRIFIVPGSLQCSLSFNGKIVLFSHDHDFLK
jgi:hypothetical protein